MLIALVGWKVQAVKTENKNCWLKKRKDTKTDVSSALQQHFKVLTMWTGIRAFEELLSTFPRLTQVPSLVNWIATPTPVVDSQSRTQLSANVQHSGNDSLLMLP